MFNNPAQNVSERTLTCILKVRYWQTTDDIRSATDVLVDRGVTEVTVWGIQRDIVYELRVLSYSRGGDGKMSEASFFTLGLYELSSNVL